MIIPKNLHNISGIYKLTIGPHIYVGSSVNLRQRLKVHFNSLQNNKHENIYLQRSVNKYGLENLKYEILITFKEIEYSELLKFEKYYIEYFNADLNLKKDPCTQNNCITTSRPVYEYDLYGNFIKEWESTSEAARHYNANSSSISCCCLKPKRQRILKNHLWSYQYPYPYKIDFIYAFDLKGNLIKKCVETTELLYLFPEINRKTLLSQFRKKIDTNIPYKNIYLSSKEDFKIPENYVPKYKEKDSWDELFSKNPIVYVFNKSNVFQYEKPLFEFKNIYYVKHKLRINSFVYRLDKNEPRYQRGKKGIIKAIDANNNISYYNSTVHAAIELFGSKEFLVVSRIMKCIKYNRRYKGYTFMRVL